MENNSRLASFYSSYANIGLYLLSFAILVIGVKLETNITIAIQFFIFLTWDIFFIVDDKNLDDRHVDQMSAHITRSSTFISAFLPFYGVMFGIIFAVDLEKQRMFIDTLSAANISIPVLIAPLVIMSFSLLFIPIKISNDGRNDTNRKPTNAFIALLLFRAFSGKISIFIFVHTVLSLSLSIS